jgi:hypothetical protein
MPVAAASARQRNAALCTFSATPSPLGQLTHTTHQDLTLSSL